MAATTRHRAPLAFALLLLLVVAAPGARAQAGEAVALEGELEVIVLDDFANARSERRTFLYDARSGRRVELVFDAGAPAQLLTGQRARVWGRAQGPGAYRVESVEQLGGSGPAAGSGAAAAAPAARNAVALLVDLRDASASSRYTLSQIASAMWTGSQSVDGLYQAASYDQVAFPPDANADGSADAFGPFAIDYSATSCNYSAWANAADAAATAAGAGGTGSGEALALLDATGPSAAVLSATVQKKTQVKLTWSGASDGSGSGIASYRIRREGGSGPVDLSSTGTSYVDSATSSGTTYTYTVRAVDRVGNVGAASNPASATPGSSGGNGGGKPRR